jgi:hypothetical protein
VTAERRLGAVLRLLDLGADPALKNAKGQRAFDLAGEYENPIEEIRKSLRVRHSPVAPSSPR